MALRVMLRGILILGALGMACSASDDGGTDRPSSCDPADVAGTYYLSADTIDGNCGEQASGVVRVGPNPDCTELDEPLVSENGCKVETHIRCPFPDVGPGATIETTAVLRNETGNGDRIGGTMTMTIREASGTLYCIGTYRVTAERQ